jgi:hypothetical protein
VLLLLRCLRLLLLLQIEPLHRLLRWLLSSELR